MDVGRMMVNACWFSLIFWPVWPILLDAQKWPSHEYALVWTMIGALAVYMLVLVPVYDFRRRKHADVYFNAVGSPWLMSEQIKQDWQRFRRGESVRYTHFILAIFMVGGALVSFMQYDSTHGTHWPYEQPVLIVLVLHLLLTVVRLMRFVSREVRQTQAEVATMQAMPLPVLPPMRRVGRRGGVPRNNASTKKR